MKKIGMLVDVEAVITDLYMLAEQMNDCANRMEYIIDFDQPVKSKIKELRGAAKIARDWKNALSKKLEGQE